MANKKLFKSRTGKLTPATDTFNEAGGPAYSLSPKHQLAQYAATGCLNRTFYATDAGAFVEIKKSTIGQDTKVPHLSYIGDADIGEDTNIAASNVTVNFPHEPGRPKGRTTIGRPGTARSRPARA